VPQETVRPRSPIDSHPGEYPTPGNGFTRELMPASFIPYNHLPCPTESQWGRQHGVHYPYPQGHWARGHHEYRPYSGTGNIQSNHMYSPTANYTDGYPYPLYRDGSHHIDFAINPAGMAPLYPGYPSGMGFPAAMPVLREGAILGSSPSNTLPPKYDTPGPHQDVWRPDGHPAQGDKVRTSVIVSEQPAEKFCGETLEWRGKKNEHSHRFTAAILSLLVLSTMFWFLVRYLLYP